MQVVEDSLLGFLLPFHACPMQVMESFVCQDRILDLTCFTASTTSLAIASSVTIFSFSLNSSTCNLLLNGLNIRLRCRMQVIVNLSDHVVVVRQALLMLMSVLDW